MTEILEKEIALHEEVSDDGFVLCVACTAETQYKAGTPIAERMNYHESGGQLCDSCDENIFGGEE